MRKGKLAWVVAVLSAGLCALGGCAISDETKSKFDAVEEAGLTYSAKKWSSLCLARAKGAPRVSARVFLEIRKRGNHGPVGKDGYQGPVVVVYCQGDAVPEPVIRALNLKPRETAKT